MRHPARIQAAIDLLTSIERSLAENGAAADVIIKAYFKTRRYAGSKDRAAITEMVYGVLRRRAELIWRTAGDVNARMFMMTCLALDGENIENVFDGSLYGPVPLAAVEQASLQKILSKSNAVRPAWVSADCPEWLLEPLMCRFGGRFDGEMAALGQRAPLDIRINKAKTATVEVEQALAVDGIVVIFCHFAPQGLRLPAKANISSHPLYRQGMIEIQDEGAQVAAALCAAAGSETVIDLCAGAGGKTLALAADMVGKGKVCAFDIVPRRLQELERRAARAETANIRAQLVPESGQDRTDTLEVLAGKADRVVLDVPCTGTGTWRRNPEARWRLTPERLRRYTALQQDLLAEGASLVCPGGRLIYITCSLLVQEDEEQISRFMASRPDFRLLPYDQVWQQVLPGVPPKTLSTIPEALCLSPESHGTDGFFICVMEKI